MQHKIFISYSFDDQHAANAVCRHLEQHGINCWIAPRNITPGQNFSAAIIEAINQTELLLVMFSSRLDRSNHAVREIERAVSKGLNILPVLIENVGPTGSYEYLLCNLHWLNASQPPLETHLGTILDAARLFLEQHHPNQNPFPPETCRLPEASKAQVALEIMADDGRILKSFPIDQQLSIGRTEGDVVISDASLSEHHCTIYPSNNRLTVKDLNSQNGVYIRIDEEVELRDQDEISIGTQIFRIEEIED